VVKRPESQSISERPKRDFKFQKKIKHTLRIMVGVCDTWKYLRRHAENLDLASNIGPYSGLMHWLCCHNSATWFFVQQCLHITFQVREKSTQETRHSALRFRQVHSLSSCILHDRAVNGHRTKRSDVKR